MKIIYSFSLIYVIFQRGAYGQNVGDICTIQGKQGKCRLLSDCQVAVEELRTLNIFPQTCGFLGPQPIVCCIEKEVGVKSKQRDICTIQGKQGKCRLLSNCQVAVEELRTLNIFPQTCGFLGPQPIVCCIEKEVGVKSKQKCKEYSKYVIESVVAPIGLPNAPDMFEEECPIEEIELIVNGEEAKSKEFPHMALIGFELSDKTIAWFCGGTLISELYVLTAAHCLYSNQRGEPKYVRLGEMKLNTDTDDARPQDILVEKLIKHPDYKLPVLYNDIGLIKLSKPAYLNSYVRPACLDSASEINVSKCVASGWGRTSYRGSSSNALMKVTLDFFSNKECTAAYEKNIGPQLPQSILEESQICAGSHTESKDTCKGDSGGPLQIINQDEKCMYTIVGVTSFGKTCGEVNMPGVYTRVSKYIEWIEKIVWP